MKHQQEILSVSVLSLSPLSILLSSWSWFWFALLFPLLLYPIMLHTWSTTTNPNSIKLFQLIAPLTKCQMCDPLSGGLGSIVVANDCVDDVGTDVYNFVDGILEFVLISLETLL